MLASEAYISLTEYLNVKQLWNIIFRLQISRQISFDFTEILILIKNIYSM